MPTLWESWISLDTPTQQLLALVYVRARLDNVSLPCPYKRPRRSR